jgi:predicted metal-dependent hydrolase
LPHFEVGARRIEYTVVTGTSRRYTYFKFKPDLTLEVSVPRGMKVDVESLMKERASWINREYIKAGGSKRILSPDAVIFGGRSLRIIYAKGAQDHLEQGPDTGEVVVRTAERGRIKELVRRWFLKESSAYVVRKVREYSPLLGVRPNRVDVREISKWGYCTRTGRLSFSWQLIALPEALREYVVLHELTHLLEFNHSPAFRERLASVCPDFRQREKELDLFVPYDRLALG